MKGGDFDKGESRNYDLLDSGRLSLLTLLCGRCLCPLRLILFPRAAVLKVAGRSAWRGHSAELLGA